VCGYTQYVNVEIAKIARSFYASIALRILIGSWDPYHSNKYRILFVLHIELREALAEPDPQREL
jgi:hypothetical protein